jgi:hypothetical protein
MEDAMADTELPVQTTAEPEVTNETEQTTGLTIGIIGSKTLQNVPCEGSLRDICEANEVSTEGRTPMSGGTLREWDYVPHNGEYVMLVEHISAG